MALSVLLFVVVSMVQGFAWPGRPPPGWHPAWWQFHGWAELGLFITMPCLMLIVFCQSAGITSQLILWLALILGFVLYYAAIYFGVYLVVRLLTRSPRRHSPATDLTKT